MRQPSSDDVAPEAERPKCSLEAGDPRLLPRDPEEVLRTSRVPFDDVKTASGELRGESHPADREDPHRAEGEGKERESEPKQFAVALAQVRPGTVVDRLSPPGEGERRVDHDETRPGGGHEVEDLLVRPENFRSQPAGTLEDARSGVPTRRAGEIEYFSRNRWADTPAHMLAPALAQAIEHSGSFRAVVRTPGAVNVDLRLYSELVRLQQNFGVRPSRVEISVRVQLVGTAPPRALASAQFDEVEDAPSDDPYGGVMAADRSLSRLVRRIADFCAAQAPGL